MKIFNKFLYLVVGVTTLTCCFGCGGSTPTPPGPVPPGPTPPELPVTTIKAKDIVGGSSIAFECTSTEEFTVNWGDGLEDHKASHTYDAAIGEVTITITGNIDGISFSSSSKVLANNDLITSVTLGESITTLPRYSFAYLKLTSITLNKTLTTIEEGAFAYCYSLPFIIIPKSVTVIDKYAFYWCDENLNIYCEAEEKPSDWSEYWNDSGCLCYWGVTQRGVSGDYVYIITSSGTYITKYNGDSDNVTIPDKIDDHTIDGIGMYAFNGKKATSITLPDTLMTIKDCAFYNCSKLTELVIPKSVTKVGDYVVYGCTSLTIYCEADSRPEGWSYAWNFFGCPCYWGYISKGTEGDFSYVTTKAGSNIVKYEGQDADVTIPNELGGQPVISISDNVFTKREDITAITLPDSLQKIGAYAFRGCIHLKSIIIPDSVKTISTYAFYECTALTEIIIPESVTVIEANAFRACYSLTIYCKAMSQPTGWSYYWNSGECPCWWGYISKGTQDGYSYIATKAGSYITEYEGTDPVVNIPAKLGGQPVIDIGDEIFKDHSEITAITLPNTLQKIGASAFMNCTNLSEIIIPISVTTIGDNAFSVCNVLTIYCEIEAQPPGWDQWWNASNRPCYWGYISKGKEGNYSYIVTKAGSYITKYEGTDAIVNIPAKLGGQSVIGISDKVFENHSEITNVTLPTTLQSIGRNAFASCSGLLEIIIPERVTTIGYSAFFASYSLTIYCEAESKPEGWDERWNFSNCPCYWGYISKGKEGNYSYVVTKAGSYITKYEGTDAIVNIPAKLGGQSVIGISDKVFENHSEITTVVFPKTLQFIGNSAFNYCSGLLAIDLPDSVVTIGNSAFHYCRGLTEVTIPSNTKSIGESAFWFCKKLSIVDLTKFNDVGVLPNAGDDAFADAENCQFKVTSEAMRDAFMAKGGGWPTEASSYIIEA